MIKYIGSKRKLVAELCGLIELLPGVQSVLDLFSGTSRVGHALKAKGYAVTANDHNAYAHKLGLCYVAADRGRWSGEAEGLLAELNTLAPAPGYFTKTFCEDARYFQPKNGARIDAIREAIARKDLPLELEAILLVSLMEAADRVDSTVGLQMAYLKQWAARAHNELSLRMPVLVDGPPGRALMLDAQLCAQQGRYDVVYLDPPYNQHKYMSNYHVWESLVRWDKPDVYGIANKRVDCKEYGSDFNSKRRIHAALAALVRTLDARYLVVSFNDEGYMSEQEIGALLATRGPCAVLRVDFKRYVGAQIGIYNPSGVKTGTVGSLRNKELIFVVACDGVLPPGLAQLGAMPM